VDERIAVVGMSLRYPDAENPEEFWENILAGRRGFRELPDERMDKRDYWSADPAAPDRFYARKAAVLRNFEFDRARFQVSGSTYRSTDLTHWLALTVADEAWRDAGLGPEMGARTGVVIGNSLTGEFSRANLMRLRWPYVRRVVGRALTGKGWSVTDVETFLGDLEPEYKAPFPAITEDTLAGGLANTIAGRVCNYFDFRGGGYTVDGACSSSLLSVISAARSLVEGDIDVAIAGGVDLSIDPFEVIGFAKTGALATSTMKIYDRDSNGFWPGEGCGMVVLMRESDAIAAGRTVYAVLAGWGVSSDGRGGITRPELEGHRAAIERAYARAGYPVSSVSYFEGHGTGTAVGDEVEVRAISAALERDGRTAPVAIGSVKGNIGHTKAAAGVAGFIKACLALRHGVIPPATGHDVPHPALGDSPLTVPLQPSPFPDGGPARCGVSAMGFGGINTHVTLEAARGSSRHTTDLARSKAVVSGRQDAELLVFTAHDTTALLEVLETTSHRVSRLSMAELADLSAELVAAVDPGAAVRASVVAADPDQAVARLGIVADAVRAGRATDFGSGVAYTPEPSRGRLGFLFPGQGSGTREGSVLATRFPEVSSPEAPDVDGAFTDTQVAQPRIVAQSVHALAVLRHLGLEATAATGHSLGEVTALHWAGALEADQTVDLAARRGRLMAEHGRPGGRMAGLTADLNTARRLLVGLGERVVVSGHNGPQQTVVSGDADAVAEVVGRAQAEGVGATLLPVSHAFHSPHVLAAAQAFADDLRGATFGPVGRRVVSTCTGRPLTDLDAADHLGQQVAQPVLFAEALEQLAAEVDLLVEVGPGQVLTALAGAIAPATPRVSTAVESGSLAPLLAVLGAAFVVRASPDLARLTAGRVVRTLPRDLTFLASPCESVPDEFAGGAVTMARDLPVPVVAARDESTLAALIDVVAQRTELPSAQITAATHPLDDLHLSSITVSQIAAETAARLGRGALPAATNLATVTLGELAEAIDAAGSSDGVAREEYAGAAPWTRPYAVRLREVPTVAPIRHEPAPSGAGWHVTGVADGLLTDVEAGSVHDLATSLGRSGAGSGVLVLAGDPSVVVEGTLREAAVETLRGDHEFLVVVDRGHGAAGFAKSFALEHPDKHVVVIELSRPVSSDELVAHVSRETRGMEARRFVEVHLDKAGRRLEPVLELHSGLTGGDQEPTELGIHEPGDHRPPMAPGQVLLVTGGGKGIVAESALACATRWGVALGIVGRSDPDQDPELAANLERLTRAGIRWAYAAADLAQQEQCERAVTQLRSDLGGIDGLLHGAGQNTPGLVTDLSDDDVRAVFAVKVEGFEHVLGATAQDPLRVVITFGSIIGRAGLEGEAHYAAANARLTALTQEYARTHPQVRTRALEWSVWAGAGMGEKLGVLEQLRARGIVPIPLQDGVRALLRLVEDPACPVTVVVAGRMGALPTLRRERSALALHRFLEQPRVHYPGVELVVEATLSRGSDRYLDDHLLDGDYLFPAVMGMEAMAQAASAVAGLDGPVSFMGVEFLLPIVVPSEGDLVLRTCALVREDGAVEVVVRTSATAYARDHFRAVVTQGAAPTDASSAPVPPSVAVSSTADELYSTVFFQGSRFRRVMRYLDMGARHALVEVDPVDREPWFAPHLPDGLLLASPGARDAMMHGIQCCVPDAVLLPMGVELIRSAGSFGSEPVVVHAREVLQSGDEYVYDVEVFDPSGTVVERWTGLRLKAVRARDRQSWSAPLIGPHLERAVERLLGASATVGLEWAQQRTTGGLAALSRALHRDVELRHAPDGRPLVDDGQVSLAHVGGVTLAVASAHQVACDLEAAAPRPAATWEGMLGATLTALAATVAAETADSPDVSATRVWGALECLRKLGRSDDLLTLDPVPAGVGRGWLVFSAGEVKVLSQVFDVVGMPFPLVVSVTETLRGALAA